MFERLELLSIHATWVTTCIHPGWCWWWMDGWVVVVRVDAWWYLGCVLQFTCVCEVCWRRSPEIQRGADVWNFGETIQNFQFVPAFILDIYKHVLNCLASSTFLCCDPKHRHSRSPYMLYTWLIFLQVSLRKHLKCRVDHPCLPLTAKYQLEGGPGRYAVGNKSWTLIFCSSL